MRKSLINQLKKEIEANLKAYLREEGIELYVAANDNSISNELLMVELEAIDSNPLEGTTLLSEIRVQLGILGKPWQCDSLVQGLYAALQPHSFSISELTVLLMSLHVETVHCVRPRIMRKHTLIKYIVEKATANC